MNEILIKLVIVAMLIAGLFSFVEYRRLNELKKTVSRQEKILDGLVYEKNELQKLPIEETLVLDQAIWVVEQYLVKSTHYKNIKYGSILDDSEMDNEAKVGGFNEQGLNVTLSNIRDQDDLKRNMDLMDHMQEKFPIRITRIEGLRESIALRLSIIGGS